MKRRLAAFLLAVSSAVAARGADSAGPWSASFQGGTDLEVSGHAIGMAQGAIAGLPTTSDGLSYRAAYGRSFHASLSVARRIAPRVEVFVRGGRHSMNGRVGTLGRASGLDVAARLGRYQEWTAEAGVRYQLRSEGKWQPYLAVVGGALFLNAIPLTLAVPAAGLEAADLPFTDRSTLALFGADLGVEKRFSHHLGLGLGIGLRYQGAPTPLDSGLQGSGLEAINDAASRWSLPLSAAITVRF
jgi:hypothetical protein